MKTQMSQHKKTTIFFSSLILIHITLLVRRMITDYSGALFWDEWDARLAMNVPITNLNLSLFWQQHNEHRLVFSKILYFLDFAWFNGSNFPLLVINLILALLILLTIFKILKLDNKNAKFNSVVPQMYCFGIFIFSILQIENFSWGFQSQFYLSVLFPLLSFYFYVCYVLKRRLILILSTYLFSVFSIGTMASGNFAIVVILLTSIFLKRRLFEIFSHLSATLVIFGFYFRNYSGNHTSPLDTLVEHPDFIFRYVLVYFTSPVDKLIFGENRMISTILVLMLFLVFSKKIYEMFRAEKYNWSTLVGLMIFIYSILIATASAGGRFESGTIQATASRYTTISLIGWFGALLVIMQKRESRQDPSRFTWYHLSFLITILFIPFQIVNSVSANDVKFHRDFASVVLLQNIKDDDSLMALYPDSSRIKNLSQSLIQEEKTIFNSKFKKKYGLASYDLKDVAVVPNCLGFVDKVRPSSDQKGFLVAGWVTLVKEVPVKFDLIATNSENRVVGIGFSGLRRDDVSNQIGSWAKKSGFNMITREYPSQIFAFDNSGIKCELKFKKN
jgi:hypothetical protein